MSSKKIRTRLARQALIAAKLSTEASVEDDLKRLNCCLNSVDLWIGHVPHKARKGYNSATRRMERQGLL